MWKTISISMPISINDHEVSEITHRQDLAARGDRGNRAAHQVSLADEQGRFIWTGRRFHLADGTELKAVSGIDDSSRFAVAPRRRRGGGTRPPVAPTRCGSSLNCQAATGTQWSSMNRNCTKSVLELSSFRTVKF
jgi:hypothetical protein